MDLITKALKNAKVLADLSTTTSGNTAFTEGIEKALEVVQEVTKK